MFPNSGNIRVRRRVCKGFLVQSSLLFRKPGFSHMLIAPPPSFSYLCLAPSCISQCPAYIHSTSSHSHTNPSISPFANSDGGTNKTSIIPRKKAYTASQGGTLATSGPTHTGRIVPPGEWTIPGSVMFSRGVFGMMDGYQLRSARAWANARVRLRKMRRMRRTSG
jgi:hypothetical protein